MHTSYLYAGLVEFKDEVWISPTVMLHAGFHFVSSANSKADFNVKYSMVQYKYLFSFIFVL